MKSLNAAFAILALAGSAMLMQPVAHAQEIETVVAQVRVIDDLRHFEGTVEAVNKSTVSAQTSGRIKAINFDVDDYVKKDEVIIRFHDIEHKARLQQAQSALMSAKARHLVARQNFERSQKLFKNGTISQASFDNVKSAFDTASAGVDSATAALEQAKEQLAYTIVRAPYSGFVVQRHVQLGEIANPGQPLMTGFSLEKLRVKAEVPQQFAKAVRAGNHGIVYAPDGSRITADDLTVFPFADPKSNTVTVRLALPANTTQVFPGMLVKTAFKTGQSKELVIPAASVVQRGEVTGAYVVKAGKIHLQQIRTGRMINGSMVEVLSGLQPGDKVARDPLKATIALASSRAAEK